MEKLLEAILLAAMPEKLREDAKEPICLSFNKEKGIKGEVTTTIVGPTSGIYAGLCTLLHDSLSAMEPNDPVRQKKTLDSIYKRVSIELGIK